MLQHAGVKRNERRGEAEKKNRTDIVLGEDNDAWLAIDVRLGPGEIIYHLAWHLTLTIPEDACLPCLTENNKASMYGENRGCGLQRQRPYPIEFHSSIVSYTFCHSSPSPRMSHRQLLTSRKHLGVLGMGGCILAVLFYFLGSANILCPPPFRNITQLRNAALIMYISKVPTKGKNWPFLRNPSTTWETI